ncbi:hypothetical protein M153_100022802 [Pseudoloma neurophilia]|uniref:General transcription and DNA repair factor IIH subunit TFB5 n=1 Tax=Pseudoloma neurophilia TaxID=146866 RepID=A0A0R0M1B5_9MICR|nr:hypothetical protein M153_100022802 [Pseudoloma neurophilia]
MVRATKGIFLQTEPSIRELIILNSNNVITLLNDDALFMKEYDCEQSVKNTLREIVRPDEKKLF